MTIKRGIFGLDQVYKSQQDGTWSLKSDVWLQLGVTYQNFGTGVQTTPQTGYFGGGSSPGVRSTVDRIDYSNDTATASPKGPLSVARYQLAATGNSSFGYFGGGWIPGSVSSVDRIDYSNDTATASPKGPLSVSRYYLAATGNSDYGYFGGGQSPGLKSTVDRIDYSNDTATASPKGPLSVARGQLAATGNQSYGYFGGGYDGIGDLNPSENIVTSVVDRIDYSNDTATASPKGPLSVSRYYLAATGNSDYGWFGGGRNPDGLKSTVDRIDYSNDTATASPKGPLSFARDDAAATGNSSFGYFGGGGIYLPYNTIGRIDYSNDTETASPKGLLSVGRELLAATSARANGLPTIETTLPPANIPFQTGQPITFFGYFGGGSNTSIIDRIDFFNDTATASPRGPLSVGRSALAATGNSSFGYFGGGSNSSLIDRIDYSNDAATASVRGPLSINRYYPAAVGNSSFGYFIGGTSTTSVLGPRTSNIDRIDYSNDTATALNRGTTSYDTLGASAVGNSSFGYFGGGASPWPSLVSTVSRIDYSNDTATTAPKGPLTTVLFTGASTGNSSFGYFGGGAIVSAAPGTIVRSSVDRVDYSNDTATASPKGPLSVARNALAATGNSSFGYFGGGSVMDRVDYSNDTATASPKGSLSVGRTALAATSAAANGLPQ